MGCGARAQCLFFAGMDRLTALKYFVRVVDSGSFSQAARELGVGQPAVSKQIAALENRLGAQLLNRTSRGLRPTPAGSEFHEAAARVLEALDAAEHRLLARDKQASGVVRVAAPPMLTSMLIVPHLPAFFARNPQMTVEFNVSERHADLVQEGLDMALRVGHLDSSGLVARRIGSMHLVTAASPGYLGEHGAPAQPAEIHDHYLVTSRYRGATSDWHFDLDGQGLAIPVCGRFSSNHPADLHAAVVAGLGIGQSARGLFDAAIRSGALVEVLQAFAPEPLPIHVVFANKRVPQRVRTFSAFIAECLQRYSQL